MKKAAKTRIIIWSVVCAVLVVALTANIIIFSSGASLFGSLELNGINHLISVPENISDYDTGYAQIPADEVKSLDIDWYGGSVEFTETTDSNVTISENYEGEEKMIWQLDSSGTLHIRFNKYGSFFFGNFMGTGSSDKNLTVKIPAQKSFDRVDIDSASADFSADALAADELDIDSASGVIYIGNLTAKNASLESVSGAINLGGVIENKLTVESVSGSAKIYADFVEADLESVSGKYEVYIGTKADSLSAETVSGSVTAFVNKDINGFTVDREGISGSITNEFAVTADSDKLIYGDGSAEISIETVSGNLTLSPVEKKPELPAK